MSGVGVDMVRDVEGGVLRYKSEREYRLMEVIVVRSGEDNVDEVIQAQPTSYYS